MTVETPNHYRGKPISEDAIERAEAEKKGQYAQQKKRSYWISSDEKQLITQTT